ncbi:hypothetical protein HMPREF3192_00694 [Atopobium deltae]|uniref:Uncharacterized protein n=1 Tax=Atopobium deltae TaxID=1393034 RepID=A0A133XVH6_9ACTN|nr:hypothetical protein HMPREF3192_00694 [Atopobium deltae]
MMRFTMHTLCIYIKIYIKFSEKVQFLPQFSWNGNKNHVYVHKL